MGPTITVTLTGRVRADRRKRLLAALPRFVSAARRHPGCLGFEYRMAPADCDALILTERWADPVAAMQHLAAERTRRFLALAHACLEDPPALTTTPAQE